MMVIQKDKHLLQLESMMFSLSRSLLESQEEQILCVVSRLPSKKHGKAKSVNLQLE